MRGKGTGRGNGLASDVRHPNAGSPRHHHPGTEAYAGRLGAGAAAEARAVLGDVDLVPLNRAVQDLAAEVGGPLLRTLDALHLASALVLGDAVSAVVCYDVRLADAARAAGLTVATPAPPPSAPEA